MEIAQIRLKERAENQKEIDSEQIEWKRAKEIFPNRISIFEGSISIDDIIQGGLGDCYFLASMSAISNTRKSYAGLSYFNSPRERMLRDP